MRVGVIGSGWGLMHVGAFRDAGADVVALCGRDRDKTATIAGREGIAIATDDARTLIDAVDLVVVASPDARHREHVTLALAAGRAVLCEKPLATTLDDARAMTALASTHTWIVFPMRALPPFEALQRWLGGRPARFVVTVRSGFGWTAASGDLGGTSHVLDAVSWLAGAEPIATSATLAADTNALHIEYANGTLAIVTFVRAPEPGLHGSWSIVGADIEAGFEAGFSAGWVPAAGGWCIGPVRAFEDGAWRDLHGPLAPEPGRPEPWAAAHRTIARRVCAAMRGDATTLPTFGDGLRVQAIVAAARASSLGRAWTPIALVALVLWSLCFVACGREPAPEHADADPTPAVVDSAPARAPHYLRAAATRACLVVGGVPHCWSGAGAPVRDDALRPLGQVDDLAMDGQRTCVLRDGRATCTSLGAEVRPEVELADLPPAESLWVSGGVVCLVTAEGALHCAGGGSLGALAALPERCGTYQEPCTRRPVQIHERDVAEVAFGYEGLACVLDRDGRARCSGALAGAFVASADAVELVMGQRHACVRGADGRVACAGWNALGQVGTGQVDDPQDNAVIATRVLDEAQLIAAGANHTCAIVRAGELWCWGDNTYGQLGRGNLEPGPSPGRVDLPPVVRIRHVAAGDDFTCALDRDDRIWCFGRDTRDQSRPSEVSVPGADPPTR